MSNEIRPFVPETDISPDTVKGHGSKRRDTVFSALRPALRALQLIGHMPCSLDPRYVVSGPSSGNHVEAHPSAEDDRKVQHALGVEVPDAPRTDRSETGRGCSHEPLRRRNPFHVAAVAYWCIFSAAIFSHFGLFMWMLRNDPQPEDPSLIYAVSNIVIPICVGMWMVLSWATTSASYRNILRTAVSFETVLRLEPGSNEAAELGRYARKVTPAVLVLASVCVVFSLAITISTMPLFTESVLLESNNSFLRSLASYPLAAGIISSYIYLFGPVTIFIPQVYSNCFCLVVAKRFTQIRRSRRSGDPRVANNLKALRAQHLAACRLTDNVSDTFYWLHLTSATFESAVLVLATYIFIFMERLQKSGRSAAASGSEEGGPPSEASGTSASLYLSNQSASTLRIFAGGFLVGLCVYITLRNWSAIRLNESAHSILDDLHGLDLDGVSVNEYIEAQSLILKLQGAPIGITVGRFFTVTRSYLLTMFGIFVSYVILLVQFETSSAIPDTDCSQLLEFMRNNFTGKN